MFVFLHIPKTAGSTLKYVVECQHTRRWSRHLYYPDISDEGRWHPQAAAHTLLNLSPRQQKAAEVLYGHFHYGVHEYLPQPTVYYTMLRNPVERLLSHYYYMRSHHHYLLSQHPDRQRFLEGSVSLDEYVSSGDFPEMDNGQTRLLAGEAGLYDRTPFGQCNGSLLEEAKSNLREHIQVVGLTERFDESLLLIQRLCGWRTPYYVNKNVTKERPQQDKIPGRTLALIQERTVLDQKLYDYGVQLFEERVAAQGPSFASEVCHFRQRNDRYAPLVARWHATAFQFRHRARLTLERLRNQQ